MKIYLGKRDHDCSHDPTSNQRSEVDPVESLEQRLDADEVAAIHIRTVKISPLCKGPGILLLPYSLGQPPKAQIFRVAEAL